jgi:hypothetical protein
MLARRHQSATMLLSAAASFWPPAQVFMCARRHQSATMLLPTDAYFKANGSSIVVLAGEALNLMT